MSDDENSLEDLHLFMQNQLDTAMIGAKRAMSLATGMPEDRIIEADVGLGALTLTTDLVHVTPAAYRDLLRTPALRRDLLTMAMEALEAERLAEENDELAEALTAGREAISALNTIPADKLQNEDVVIDALTMLSELVEFASPEAAVLLRSPGGRRWLMELVQRAIDAERREDEGAEG